MGNKEHVFVYNAEYEQWLRQRGYPCPSARSTNRMPTTHDVLWAIAQFPAITTHIYRPYLDVRSAQNETMLTIIGSDWEDHQAVAPYIALRGFRDWEIAFVAALCERCGQLGIYPDSGAAAIILDANIDREYYTNVWKQSYTQEDDWRYVHETLYGQV